MAELIDKVCVKKGRLIRVVNTERKRFSNANKQYFAVQVEDAEGNNERCILFTEREIKNAYHRASKNKEDLTKLGFFADVID